ncbi:hypothetical protein BaRGS_00035983, partial [Batillaria attramentaria]
SHFFPDQAPMQVFGSTALDSLFWVVKFSVPSQGLPSQSKMWNAVKTKNGKGFCFSHTALFGFLGRLGVGACENLNKETVLGIEEAVGSR